MDSESISTPSSNLTHKTYETNIRLENHERITKIHININSIRNKFDCLTAFTKNEVDILINS